MLITIDTEKLTDGDLAILTHVMQTRTGALKAENDGGTTVAAGSTTRAKRRTKAEMEAARAAEAADKGPAESEVQEAPGTTEEPADDGNQEATHTPEGLSDAEFSELCSRLIAKSREDFKALLDEYGVKRATLVPDEKRAAFADAVRAKLA